MFQPALVLQPTSVLTVSSVNFSIKAEVESLKLGNGQVFHGEGILAVTKALLQAACPTWAATRAPVSYMLPGARAPVEKSAKVNDDLTFMRTDREFNTLCINATKNEFAAGAMSLCIRIRGASGTSITSRPPICC